MSTIITIYLVSVALANISALVYHLVAIKGNKAREEALALLKEHYPVNHYLSFVLYRFILTPIGIYSKTKRLIKHLSQSEMERLVTDCVMLDLAKIECGIEAPDLKS